MTIFFRSAENFSTHITARFCPSLTPLRFLRTLGRRGKQHCGISRCLMPVFVAYCGGCPKSKINPSRFQYLQILPIRYPNKETTKRTFWTASTMINQYLYNNTTLNMCKYLFRLLLHFPYCRYQTMLYFCSVLLH